MKTGNLGLSWLITYTLLAIGFHAIPQDKFPHPEAHAHNDYENQHPLVDALKNGFMSVEADVHLWNGKLLVGHNNVNLNSPELKDLYLIRLDSLLKQNNGAVYANTFQAFYLMIDIKTPADETYPVLKKILLQFPTLICGTKTCPVKIILSGNRPIDQILQEGYCGIALDGRPNDLGKGYSQELMPIISDSFGRWGSWNPTTGIPEKDLKKIKELARLVHAEGKKLRLWAIPDHEKEWEILLKAGVDLINTDYLASFNTFLKN